MSPLWRDHVGIHVAPRRLLLTRQQRGLRSRQGPQSCVDVSDGHFAHWAPALARLRQELQQAEWRDADAHVVLADHWIHYALVPWSGSLNAAERIAHARVVLSRTFGEVVDDCTIVLAQAAAGRASIAAAVCSQLLTDLQEVLQEARLKLATLQPHLAAAYNLARSRLPAAGGWFVTLDEGSLGAVHATASGWDQVHAIRIGADWSAELRRLRTFARVAASNAGEQRVFVDAPAWLRAVAGDSEDGLEWLEHDPASGSTVGQLVRMKGH